MRKVVFCTPTLSRPIDQYFESLEASIPFVERAGWTHGAVWEIGNPYISCARAFLLRKAIEANADVIVFLDHDIAWRPQDLMKLLSLPGPVVAGTYRFKDDSEERYMGAVYSTPDGFPLGREDGCIKASAVPAGFLKITRGVVDRFSNAYPQLEFMHEERRHIDLFNHGADKGVWYGEDYAFSHRWIGCGGEIWLYPDFCIDHYRVGFDPQGNAVNKVYKGNFHNFLRRQPGGDLHQLAA